MAGARRLVAAALVMATAGCSALMPGPAPIADGVTVLAKADEWSPSLTGERFGEYFSVLEIASDEGAVRAAWDETVPEGLPDRSGEPREPGRYGSVEDVDLERQVLVVYSSGQSGACPGWVTDIGWEGSRVEVTTGEHVPGDGCTDDYRPYRLVLAVDRDKLPTEVDLPTEHVVVDGRDLAGLVTSYPAG